VVWGQFLRTPKTNRIGTPTSGAIGSRKYGVKGRRAGAHLLLLLELARGLHPEVVGEGSGDDPRGEVAPPADAAERVAHERARVPQRPVPPPRRRHLNGSLSLRSSTAPTDRPALVGRKLLRSVVSGIGPQERNCFFLCKSKKGKLGQEAARDSSDGLAGSFTSQADLSLNPI
jgi:hypothetical protein